MIEDFIIRAFAAGIGIAIVAGPFGSFIVWRRMAYFGATLSHGALLGVALALLVDLSPMIGVLAIGLAMVPVLGWLQARATLSSDTLLGLLAHAMLALGLVLLAFMPHVRVDLMGYLFGDVLAVTLYDVLAIYLGGAAVLLVLWLRWRPLLAGTVNAELAAAEGLEPRQNTTLFMLLTAVVIAIAMKVVGILLILSLLIIPPAAARGLARTPEDMAILASLIGCVAVAGGLGGALVLDTPAGPSIVVAALVLFLVSIAWVSAGLARLQSK